MLATESQNVYDHIVYDHIWIFRTKSMEWNGKKNLLVNIRRESDHSTSMSREKCYFSLECSRCDPVWEKVAVIAEMDTNPNAKNNEKQ